MAHLNLGRVLVLVSFVVFVFYLPPANAQNSLRKEISDLKKSNRLLHQRLRKLESALVVTADQVKIKKLLVERDLNVGSNLSVGSNAAIGRNLSAGSNLSVGSNAVIGRNLSADGDIAGKNLTLGDNLIVKNIRLNGDIKIRNKVTLSSRSLSANGNYLIKTSGKLIFKGSKVTGR